MASSIADYLVTDDLTILLGLIAATVFLVNNLYKPQPLVHPILLGRQSDVGRARNPGESAVYRNYGTGLMGRVRTLSRRVWCGRFADELDSSRFALTRMCISWQTLSGRRLKGHELSGRQRWASEIQLVVQGLHAPDYKP